MADADKVSLANVALVLMGAKTITSFSQDCPEARAVSSVYDTVRDEVLEAEVWSFAGKRASLVAIVDPPTFTDDRLTTIFTKPADFLSMREYYPTFAAVSIESNGIYSDQSSGLKIKYTYRNDDPTTYPAAFRMAMAYRLAAALCFVISNAASKANDLLAAYEKIYLPRAQAQDAKQGTPKEAAQDDALWARQVGASSFPPQASGTQTVHPYW